MDIFTTIPSLRKIISWRCCKKNLLHFSKTNLKYDLFENLPLHEHIKDDNKFNSVLLSPRIRLEHSQHGKLE